MIGDRIVEDRASRPAAGSGTIRAAQARGRSPGPFLRHAVRAASDLRRFDLALGVDLATALALSFVLALRLATGSVPEGLERLAWAAALGLFWGVIAGGIVLHRLGRTGAATTLLAVLAGPVAVIGLALSPIALLSVAAAVSSPTEFRLWLGPEPVQRLTHWAVALSFIAALLPASLLTRRIGRHVLGQGIAVGAVAMISVLLIGLAGGFLYRGIR
jgi:hypothetical protein